MTLAIHLACRQLIHYGADDPRDLVGWYYPSYRDWLAYWLPLLTRPLRHPGNHKYAWGFRRPVKSILLPYPKRGDHA